MIDIDPAAIGTFIGTVFTAAGATIGGLKAIEKISPQNGNGKRPVVCQEHHHMVKSVETMCSDMKSHIDGLHKDINDTREDVAFIRGLLERPRN